MRKLDETKLARLHTAGELLEEEYGGARNLEPLSSSRQSDGRMARYFGIAGNSFR